tara:strand:- start:2692 stop:3555 length:864 start_codon:yes stop_codon:yes gene_type:complete
MNDLEHEFGKDRVIDTPVSENATTGMALGAALTGLRTVVVHPRMDFMILATDQIVNQAAKWQSMLGGGIKIPLTVRGIINRGGEQGAQHSQALHAWYSHIPGLRVVMPSTALDARDLLISSVLCNDPVIYIDDRWCYDHEEDDTPIKEEDLLDVRPRILNPGDDISIVSLSYGTLLALEASKQLKPLGISTEIIDLRIISPLHIDKILKSVVKTGRLLVIDGGWASNGLSSEIIASISEKYKFENSLPQRITISNTPAPTSKPLESEYYIKVSEIVNKVRQICSPAT